MTPEEAKQAAEEKDAQVLRAYRVVFGSPGGQMVLADLARFCRVTVVGEGVVDIPATFVRIGRYEVIDRIRQCAQLTDDELHMMKYGRIKPKLGDDENA